MSKKKKKKARFNGREDYHHFLWMKRTWCKGWAKRLREHPYCGARLPQMTLHASIHQKMNSVPMPDANACKAAYIALNSWLEARWISLDDLPEKKLENIARCFRAGYPRTAKELDRQRQIIAEFYNRPLE